MKITITFINSQLNTHSILLKFDMRSNYLKNSQVMWSKMFRDFCSSGSI